MSDIFIFICGALTCMTFLIIGVIIGLAAGAEINYTITCPASCCILDTGSDDDNSSDPDTEAAS